MVGSWGVGENRRLEQGWLGLNTDSSLSGTNSLLPKLPVLISALPTKQPNQLKPTQKIAMAEKSIEEKVKDIIVEQLGVNPEQVTTNASFIEDLGADSLDTVELVMAFEEEFSVEVPDEDAEKLQTVGDVVKYIEEKAK